MININVTRTNHSFINLSYRSRAATEFNHARDRSMHFTRSYGSSGNSFCWISGGNPHAPIHTFRRSIHRYIYKYISVCNRNSCSCSCCMKIDRIKWRPNTRTEYSLYCWRYLRSNDTRPSKFCNYCVI